MRRCAARASCLGAMRWYRAKEAKAKELLRAVESKQNDPALENEQPRQEKEGVQQANDAFGSESQGEEEQNGWIKVVHAKSDRRRASSPQGREAEICPTPANK